MLSITPDLLEYLYWTRWLSTREIAKIIGKSQATVRKMMFKAGLPLRSNRDWLRAKIDSHTLYKLYWENGMSIAEIAEKIGVSEWTVHQRMVKFNIPRRKIGESNLKQQKLPFSGDPIERSYLLGLRAGDLSARWKGKRIRVEVCTSHPAMIELFKSLFEGYASVGMCPEYNKRAQTFRWRVFVDLDTSFYFLVKKPEFIATEILFSKDLFLAFLAGYTDAEGSIIMSPNREQIVYYFRICSEDFNLLRDFYKKLREIGYHLRLVLDKEKGTDDGFSKLRTDYWRLELSRKNDTIQLLQQLPIRHSEKKRKWDLLLRIQNQTRWLEVRDKVLSLKAEIKREVRECVQRAVLAYSKKHTF